MAGLYAAWRLLTSGVRPDRIGLFEADARVGGRVLTVRPPQDENFALDLGAHSFSSSHSLVAGLVRQFGLNVVPCAGQVPSAMVNLRGRTLSNAEIARRYFRKPFAYDVSAYLQRRGPARILRKALAAMPRGEDGQRLLGGRPLAEWGLDEAMLQVLKPDELRYLSDRLSYSFWHTPVHAGAALDWTGREMFRKSGAMSELPGGMAQLADALAQAIRQLGCDIALRYGLAGIDLDAAPSGPIGLHFETAGSVRRTVNASRVVLALPPAGINRVEGLADRPELRALTAALAPQRAVTTALVYPDAWWRPAGMAAGYSVTDMPARHIRHYGAEPWRKPGLGALMSYSDGDNADFWGKLSGGNAGNGWVGPEHPVAQELHRQALEMFEAKLGLSLPEPIGAFSHNWTEGFSGAAFHLWSAGSKPERALTDALNPLPGLPLHVCGEAWSMRQGWIEGALETVDMLLERHVHMAQAATR
jgi:monoamine oxidase